MKPSDEAEQAHQKVGDGRGEVGFTSLPQMVKTFLISFLLATRPSWQRFRGSAFRELFPIW